MGISSIGHGGINYYQLQLNRIKGTTVDGPAKDIKVKFSTYVGETHWMNLNSESIPIIIKFLQDKLYVGNPKNPDRGMTFGEARRYAMANINSDEQMTIGTRTGRWYVIGKEDRDYNVYGIPFKEFVEMMPQKMIWAEMARRKVLFHSDEKWDEIDLWGLFEWEDINYLIKMGLLITNLREENVTIWVRPSKEAWEEKIKPLIEKYSLDELTEMAGW